MLRSHGNGMEWKMEARDEWWRKGLRACVTATRRGPNNANFNPLF